LIRVEVAYARPETQALLSVELRDGATVHEAIEASGIRARFPEIDLASQPVGVFGRHRALTDALRDGERVEIYRPLVADPKQMRRERARRASR
jgi:putative ubiquitin-RnfH superfamily antitoxin RatB of RatAB toxin-antitoxin module